ncbi:unnamed protein product [Nezara viridula]|uniref:Uncharacterized protein n=1 Tax=Nezara viridula TaxID=85310 RepID=A0A9P0HN89_NEZVI|nr:unnamed protein product [Nezara viridula]
MHRVNSESGLVMIDPRLSAIFTIPRILGTFPMDEKFLLSKKWLPYSLIILSINFSDLIQILAIQVGNINVYSENAINIFENLISLSDSVHNTYDPYVLISVVSISIRLVLYFYALLLPMFPGLLWKNIVLIVYIAASVASVAAIAHSSCSFLQQNIQYVLRWVS